MDGDAGLIEAAAAVKTEKCLWCDDEFEPRKGGSPQRFCHPKHRAAFHSAGRRWAERAVLSGRLTVDELRGDPLEACTVDAGGEGKADECHSAVPKLPLEERALSLAQRARAVPLALEVSINAEGVLDLCALRWLDPDKLEDPMAINDAIVELTNAAFKLRLQPPTV